MPSLCVISDTHRRHREIHIPPCDILIHCGDFCSFQQEDQATLEDVDDWFAGLPATHIICIGGNHDFPLHRRQFRFDNAEYLLDCSIKVAGLRIYGSPWCPDLADFAFYLPDADLAQKWRQIPSGIDILITHTPPHGVLDIPSSGNLHLGCKHLQNELMRIQPRLHVFGHVHASHGSWQDKTTHFRNASVVGGATFEVRHGATKHEMTVPTEPDP